MDEISALDWDIIAEDEYEYEEVRNQISEVKNFLLHPNKNGESFVSLERALIKDILEIDAGVIVKVFDINSYNFNDIEPKSGAPMLKPFGERKMTEIYIRDGASFLKEIDKFGFVNGYWQYSYQIPAHPMWFNKEEIVYCSEHTRSMSCYGYARTQAILDIVKSLHYSTLYNKRFFEESSIPDGALALLDTNEDEINEFRNYWNNEFKAQPHKVAVINKDIKWTPFATTNKELEFLETQKWYFNMVISGYGLSPSELGITDDLNRANSATQSELVKRKGIRPFLRVLENAFNEVISEFGYEGIKFQFIYDDPAEKKLRLDNWNSELNMGVKTINEVREEMGLEPIPGGDTGNSILSRMGQANQGSMPQETTPNEQGEGMEEQVQSTGYHDELDRAEGENKERINTEEKERKENIKNPYGDDKRPNGNFKGLKDTKTMTFEDLITEHKKLVEIMESGDAEKIKAEAENQKKELEGYIQEAGVKKKVFEKYDKLMHCPKCGKETMHSLSGSGNKAICEECNTETSKGVDDGQYYREQPISQPIRPSGAHFQPQTESRITDTALPTIFQGRTDTNPSHLGDSYAKPGVDTFDNKDRIHCPICGQPTLTYLNAIENLEDDIKCTQCSARFRAQDLLDAPLMEEMANVLQANNMTKPVGKEFKKTYDIDMDVKSYVGFDISKSMPETINYADSKEYKKLLKEYLSDLSNPDREKIIELIKEAIKKGESIKNLTKKIDKVIDDKERSEVIARTEIVRVANEGLIQLAESTGVTRMEYLSAPEDGRLCDECQKHNGKKYTLKEAKGLLPIHPHCRCTLLSVIE